MACYNCYLWSMAYNLDFCVSLQYWSVRTSISFLLSDVSSLNKHIFVYIFDLLNSIVLFYSLWMMVIVSINLFCCSKKIHPNNCWFCIVVLQ